MRVAVLISGRGSNLQALIDAGQVPIALVLSNRPRAGGLARAEAAGVPTAVVNHKDYADREAFEAAMQAVLEAQGIELICLAGFMRLLTAGFVQRWPDRILNIHPSLLPSFKGLRTHQAALDAGVKVHGCTVHFVRPALDDGPIIAQTAVPVLDDDDAERLAARELEAEHTLYPACLAQVVAGRVRVEGQRTRLV